VVEADKLSGCLEQTQYVDELFKLEWFGMKELECNTVSTPMVSCLTDKDPEKLEKKEHELYWNMVGRLLHLPVGPVQIFRSLYWSCLGLFRPQGAHTLARRL
jgi:hypothetical protein